MKLKKQLIEAHTVKMEIKLNHEEQCGIIHVIMLKKIIEKIYFNFIFILSV